jgi:translation initiation factor IF-2
MQPQQPQRQAGNDGNADVMRELARELKNLNERLGRLEQRLDHQPGPKPKGEPQKGENAKPQPKGENPNPKGPPQKGDSANPKPQPQKGPAPQAEQGPQPQQNFRPGPGRGGPGGFPGNRPGFRGGPGGGGGNRGGADENDNDDNRGPANPV